jgi:hypothetical protein
MAELEIIKHTKKAYTIFKSSNMNVKNKITDILTEILIIVFAVSISAGFTALSGGYGVFSGLGTIIS